MIVISTSCMWADSQLSHEAAEPDSCSVV